VFRVVVLLLSCAMNAATHSITPATTRRLVAFQAARSPTWHFWPAATDYTPHDGVACYHTAEVGERALLRVYSMNNDIRAYKSGTLLHPRRCAVVRKRWRRTDTQEKVLRNLSRRTHLASSPRCCSLYRFSIHRSSTLRAIRPANRPPHGGDAYILEHAVRVAFRHSGGDRRTAGTATEARTQPCTTGSRPLR